MSPITLFMIFSTLFVGLNGKLKKSHPPHCTTVTKNTDYVSKFKLDYPVAYVPPGQHEAYQQTCLDLTIKNRSSSKQENELLRVVHSKERSSEPSFPNVPSVRELPKPISQSGIRFRMYCINPAAVNTGMTTVCDWAAPPQVQFTLGDEYMHVVRIDPSGRFLGNAVITTYQLCSHNISHEELNKPAFPTVTLIRQ